MSDQELVEALDKLASLDRTLNRDFLGHLGAIDERRIIKTMGFASLFVYCTKRLKLSEAAAYWRIFASGIAKRFPEIYDMIESGELSLTTIVTIGPHLTKENYLDLLNRVKSKTRREVQMIAASLQPIAARRDMARTIPSTGSAEWPPAPTAVPTGPAPVPSNQPAQPISFTFDKIEAVDGQKVRLHFDVGPETAKLLERAREVMRHKFPLASFEDIVKEALKLLLEERDPEIKLKLEKEDAKKVLTDARRVPVWVQRKVWRRDGGRCAYVAEDGTRCEERKWLEYDHIVPYAKGGRSDDPKNIRLLCRSHNQLNGWLEFPPGATASA